MDQQWKQALREKHKELLSEVHRRERRLELEMRRRKNGLDKDKVFLKETTRLSIVLGSVLKRRPAEIKHFFNKFRRASQARIGAMTTYIKGCSDDNVRNCLTQYVNYWLRFGAKLRYQDVTPHFVVEVSLPLLGPMLHVRFAEGKLLPGGTPSRDDQTESRFESEEVDVPKAISKMIQSGIAKFVQVDDEDGSSALRHLASLSYHDSGITFFLLTSTPPQLFCLFGESVSTKVLTSAQAAVTEFQRDYLGRERRGRRPELKRQAKMSKLLLKPGREKDKAGTLEGNVTSNQVLLSRFKRDVMQGLEQPSK